MTNKLKSFKNLIAMSAFAAVLAVGYCNKQLSSHKTNDNSDNNTRVLANATLLTKGMQPSR